MTTQLGFKFAKASREALKRKHRERKRIKRLCPMIKHLERELGKATAEEAALILIQEFQLEHANMEFTSGSRLTVADILDIPGCDRISAEAVSPIKFWGGPPNREAKCWQGSLLTMLMDRIMYMHTINGQYADLVGSHA